MEPTKFRLTHFSALVVFGAFLSTVLVWALFLVPHRKSSVHAARLAASKSKTTMDHATGASIAKGRQVFVQEGCWYCHHSTLSSQQWAQPLHQPRSAAWLATYLRTPQRMNRRTHKQSYRWISEDPVALNSLALYLGSLQGISRGGLTQQERWYGKSRTFELAEGKRLYLRQCAGCHGRRGMGLVGVERDVKRKPTDLTNPSTFVCRSGFRLRVEDVERTLRRGMSHGVKAPLSRSLSPKQIRSLVEYVRQFSPSGYSPDGARNKVHLTQMQLPKRRKLRNPHFRTWQKKWWEREYAAWKQTQLQRHQKVWMSYRDWKDWQEWQRFARWVRADVTHLRSSQQDWLSAQRATLRSRFPEAYDLWKKQGARKRFRKWIPRWLFVWMKRDAVLRKEERALNKRFSKLRKAQAVVLKQAKAKKRSKKSKMLAMGVTKGDYEKEFAKLKLLKKKLKERRRVMPSQITLDSLGEPTLCKLPRFLLNRLGSWKPHCMDKFKYKIRSKIDRAGYVEYDTWRERIENNQFRKWKKNQSAWLYRAWQGKKVYKELRCASCHGMDGSQTSAEIPIQAKHTSIRVQTKKYTGWVKQKKVVAPFARGQFRCGTRPDDIFRTMRSLVEGSGPHFHVTSGQMRKHLGSYPMAWSRFKSSKKLDTATRRLVAYLLFLSKELPITAPTSSETPSGK